MATQAGNEPQGAVTPGPSTHSHHGNSVAAWTMVIIVMIGSVLVSVGIAAESLTLDIIGVVIIVIGLVTGKVLSLAGYGSVKPADPEQPHGVA